jgi:hypothetical protein
VSVLLPFDQLDDTFEADELGIRLIGAGTSKIFTLSDPVAVRIEEANVQTRDIVGSLVRHEPSGAPSQAQRYEREARKKRRGRQPRSKR